MKAVRKETKRAKNREQIVGVDEACCRIDSSGTNSVYIFFYATPEQSAQNLYCRLPQICGV